MIKQLGSNASAICSISSLLIGLSVSLLNGLSSSQLYYVLRYIGQSPLEAHGLWFFLGRFCYLLGMLVIAVMISIRLTKTTVCFLHWLLFLCYSGLYFYLRCHAEVIEPSRLFTGLLITAHIVSIALQSGYFFVAFDSSIPGGRTNSPKYVLSYMFGSGLSGCVMMLLVSGQVDKTAMNEGLTTELGSLFQRITIAFACITFFSAVLWSYVTFHILGGQTRQYLQLSVWGIICIPFKNKCLNSMLFCSIAWLITPMCGIMMSTFLFNLPMKYKSQLESIQQLFYVVLSFLLLIGFVFIILEMTVKRNVSVDFLGQEIGDAVAEVDCQSNKNLDLYEDYDGFSMSIGKRVFRNIPPWCLLPAGFWSSWESWDNDMATFLQHCIGIYQVLQAVNGGESRVLDRISTKEKGVHSAYRKVMKAKYRLLSLFSKFIAMCDSLGNKLREKRCFTMKEECPCKTMKGKMDEFVKNRACVDNTWTDWNCDNGICTKKKKIDGVICQLCGKLLACVTSAQMLIRSMRRSPSLRDERGDSADAYFYGQSSLLLEQYFMKLLVLVFYYKLVEDWLILCELVDETQQKCMDAIAAFPNTCCTASTTGGDSCISGDCGCKALIKLGLCCQALHRKQCEIACIGGNVTSSSVNRYLPTSSHTRALLLLTAHFSQLSKSPLAVDRADRTCCQNHEKTCSCCRYSARLDSLLESWLTDVSSNMSQGDHLLREAIDMVSYVVDKDADKFTSHVPDYLKYMRTYVALARKSSYYVAAMYNSKVLLKMGDGDTGSGSTAAGSNSCTPTPVPNFICGCGNEKNKYEDCECLIEACNDCLSVERNTLSILENVCDLYCHKSVEKACELLKSGCEELQTTCDGLTEICKNGLENNVCIESIGSGVKELFTSLLCTSGTAQPTPNPCSCGKDKLCCSVPCLNRDLANGILAPCGNEENKELSCSIICKCVSQATSTDAAQTTSSSTSCSATDCKSLACVLKNFADVVGCTADGKGTQCTCGSPAAPGACKDSLKTTLQECCKQLGELKKKLHCETNQDNSVSGKICCLDKTVENIDCILCDIHKSLQDLEEKYCIFSAELCNIEKCIHDRYNTELAKICELKKFLDDNGSAYSHIFNQSNTVVKLLSELSQQHASDMDSFVNQVNDLTTASNRLCDRAQNIDKEHTKCAAGLEAERFSIAVAASSKHQFIGNKIRDKTGYIVDMVNTYMWHFDVIWTVVFMIMYYTCNINKRAEDWLFKTNRNMSLMFLVKGAMMTFSYFGILCTYNRLQGYLLNISMIIGFIWALLTSWICQWYVYEGFLGLNSVSIEKWIRLLHPTSGETKVEYIRKYSWLWSIIKADIKYAYRFLKGGIYADFFYDPYKTSIARLVRYDEASVSFSNLWSWKSYKTSVLADVFKGIRKRDFTNLLYYAAFQSVPASSLGFLLNSPMMDPSKVPKDLLWAAWKRQATISLKNCVIYNFLEKAYNFTIENFGKVQQFDPKAHLIKARKQRFSSLQQQNMANQALDINFGIKSRVSGKQMKDLEELFVAYYKWQWFTTPQTEVTIPEEPPEEEYRNYPSEWDRKHRTSWLRGLSCTIFDWREDGLKNCDKLYRGSEDCKRLVNTTADSVKSCMWTFKRVPTFYELMERCNILRHKDTAEEGEGIYETHEEPKKEALGRTFVFPDSIIRALKLDEYDQQSPVPISELLDTIERPQEEEPESYDYKSAAQLYFLGEWLRRMGVCVSSSDVRQIMQHTLSDHPME